MKKLLFNFLFVFLMLVSLFSFVSAIDTSEEEPDYYIYTGHSDGTIRKINPETSEDEWVIPPISGLVGGAVLFPYNAQGHFYFIKSNSNSGDVTVNKINFENGNLISSSIFSSGLTLSKQFSLSPDENYLYVGSGESSTTAPYVKAIIKKISLVNGQEVWSYNTGVTSNIFTGLTGLATSSDGNFVFFNYRMSIVKINSLTGTAAWSISNILVSEWQSKVNNFRSIISIESSVFSSDGKYLYLSGTLDNTLGSRSSFYAKIDTENNVIVWIKEFGLASPATKVAISTNGANLNVLRSGKIEKIDVSTGEMKWTNSPSTVSKFEPSGDGSTYYSGYYSSSGNKFVFKLDSQTGEKLWEKELQLDSEAYSINFLGSGADPYLFINNKGLWKIDSSTGEFNLYLGSHAKSVTDLTVSRSGENIFSLSVFDNTLRNIDSSTGKTLDILFEYYNSGWLTGQASSVEESLDGKSLYFSSKYSGVSSIKKISLENGEIIWERDSPSCNSRVYLSPNEEFVYCLGVVAPRGNISKRDALTGDEIWNVPGSYNGIYYPSKDGNFIYFVAGSNNNIIMKLNTQTKEVSSFYSYIYPNRIFSFLISPDEKELYVALQEGYISKVNILTGQEEWRVLHSLNHAITSSASWDKIFLNSNGNIFIGGKKELGSSRYDGRLKEINSSTGSEINDFSRGEGIIDFVIPEAKQKNNLRNLEKYEKKSVFIIPDEDWRMALSGLVLATGQKNILPDIEGSVVNNFVFRHIDCGLTNELEKRINDVSDRNCFLPALVYHKEGEKYTLGHKGDGVIQNIPSADGTYGFDNIVDFVSAYKPENVFILRGEEDLGVTENLIEEINSQGLETVEVINGEYNSEEGENLNLFWSNIDLVILVDHGGNLGDERELNAYKNGLIGAQIAKELDGAPLVFFGESNFDNVKDFLKDKKVVLVGDLPCTSCLTYLSENSELAKIKNGKIEKYSADEVFDAPLESFSNLKWYSSKGVERDTSYMLDFAPLTGIIVNPKDILSDYCEPIQIGENIFNKMCKESLLSAYIPYTDGFIFSENGPAIGPDERQQMSEDMILNLLNGNDALFEQIQLELEERNEEENLIAMGVKQTIKNSFIEMNVLKENREDPNTVRPSLVNIFDQYKQEDIIDQEKCLVEPAEFVIVGGQKAIPYGEPSLFEFDGSLIVNSYDEKYRLLDLGIEVDSCPEYLEDFVGENDQFYTRTKRYSGKGATDVSIKLNKELFNINTCNGEGEEICQN